MKYFSDFSISSWRGMERESVWVSGGGSRSGRYSGRNAGVATEEELKCTLWSTANAACRRSARLSPSPRWVWRFGGRARTPLRFILTDGNSRSIQAHFPAKRIFILYTPSNQPEDRSPLRQVELSCGLSVARDAERGRTGERAWWSRLAL